MWLTRFDGPVDGIAHVYRDAVAQKHVALNRLVGTLGASGDVPRLGARRMSGRRDQHYGECNNKRPNENTKLPR